MPQQQAPPLGKLLRRYRLAAALSQEALAEASGVSARTISDLERGLRDSARLETVRLLADALELDGLQREAFLAASGGPDPADMHFGRITRHVGRTSMLPIPPNHFIGRKMLVTALSELVNAKERRLISLTGPGGVGKTRLAIEVARLSLPSFVDGVVYVDLTPVPGPALVPLAIGQALGIGSGHLPLPEQLAASLMDQNLLLVLDNFEHVVDAAPVAGLLSATCPAVSVLVTSRVRLRLTAERELPVPPFDLPASGDSLTSLQSNEAMRLFEERAQAIQPAFSISEQNGGAIAAICERLDGLPLAIELAAGRLNVLTPLALLQRLDRRLPLLTGGSRDLAQRHKTMRGAIASSYELLPGGEQELLRRLAVYVSGFSLRAAEAVAVEIGIPERDAIDAVGDLADSSLIRRAESFAGEPRFGMLETIREFAIEQLREREEEAEARLAHARFFSSAAQQLNPGVLREEPLSWFNSVQDELENLQTALEFWLNAGSANDCLQLATVCGPYWNARGPMPAGWLRLREVIAMAGSVRSSLTCEVLFWASHVALVAGEIPEAIANSIHGLVLARELGDRRNEAAAIFSLALCEELQLHLDESAVLYNHSLATWRELSEPWAIGVTLFLLANSHFGQGDFQLALDTEIEASKLFKEIGDLSFIAATDLHLGLFAEIDGNLGLAAGYFRQSLSDWIELDETTSVFKSLVGLADVAAQLGACEAAARLLGATDGHLRRTGFQLYPFDKPGYQRAESTSKASLGDVLFRSIYEDGQDLKPDGWLVEADAIVALAQANR